MGQMFYHVSIYFVSLLSAFFSAWPQNFGVLLFALSLWCMCACAYTYVCTLVYFLWDYYSWLFVLLPPLLSLPLKPISAMRQLSFRIIAFLFIVVLSSLIRQHKGFKLAKMLACWAYSAATTSCRSTEPLDAEIDDCSEGIRNCWWLPGRFIHAEPLLNNIEGGSERFPSFSCCLAGGYIVLVPGSR